MTLLSVSPTHAATVISVGIGQYAVTRDPATQLTAYGLGSCVALALWDGAAHVAGMLHVLLPEPPGGTVPENPARFAATGVPLLLREMEAAGAMRARLRVAAAGGAQMLSALSAAGAIGGIGARNAEVVRHALHAAGLTLAAADFGGTAGRTVTLDAATGQMTVRLAGGTPRDLA